jgi:hypothetical protein
MHWLNDGLVKNVLERHNFCLENEQVIMGNALLLVGKRNLLLASSLRCIPKSWLASLGIETLGHQEP